MPKRLPRRLLALAAAGCALRAGAQPAAGYRFRMIREGRDLGFHTVTFQRSGEELAVRSTVAILVRVLGITVFRFDHLQQELWRGDRLLRASGREARGSNVEEMAAEAAGDALLVRGTGGEFRLAGEAAPSAW